MTRMPTQSQVFLGTAALVLVGLLACGCFSAAAQTAIPESGSARSNSSAERAPVATDPQLRARTRQEIEQGKQAERRITLDIVVSGPDGVPVHALQQQDFKVFDNAKAQELTSWHALSGSKNIPPTEVILLLDTMNPIFQDVVLMRQGMEGFLRRNHGSLPFPVTLGVVTETGVSFEAASRDGNALAASLVKTPIRLYDTAQGSNGWVERAQHSIRALTQLAAEERTRPGRKLVIWTGPGWPLLTFPSITSDRNQRLFFRTIVDLNTRLRQAHITLYSVIPLNLSIGTGLRTFLYQDFLKGVENPSHVDAANLALQVLATQSGGQVLDKNGDLSAQISRCVQDADAYYELTFDTEAAQHADAYHRLEVQVNKPGLVARTTTVYYAQP
jgi:VWFA-related protein